MRYIFHCLNGKCSSKERKLRKFVTSTGEITKFAPIERFLIEKPESEKDGEEHCEHCGEVLKPIGIHGVRIFSGLSLMTKAEKGEMLKKRSSKHFRTNGELRDRVRDLDERSS